MSSVESMETQGTDSNQINKLQKAFEGKALSECFAILYAKLEKVENSVDGIQAQVSHLDERVTSLESYRNFAEDSLKGLHEETIPGLEEKIQGERIERLKLENWRRKWNLVIRGVPGVQKKSSQVTIGVVRKFLIESLKIPENTVKNMILQGAHRLPSGDDSKRNIIVRLSSLLDRDDVLERAMKLRPGSGYSVTPDLAPETGRLRSQLLRERALLSVDEKRKTKLIYTKEYQFVKLMTRK